MSVCVDTDVYVLNVKGTYMVVCNWSALDLWSHVSELARTMERPRTCTYTGRRGQIVIYGWN